MEKNESSALAVVLVVLLLLVAAGGAFLFMGTRARSQALEAEARARAAEERALAAIELAASGSRADDASRAVLADAARTSARDPHARTATDARAGDGDDVSLRVVVERNPWLDADWTGSVVRVDADGVREKHAVAGRRLRLSSVPESAAEFPSVEIAGLVARVVELRKPENSLPFAGSASDVVPVLELVVAIEEGALVRWAASVRQAERDGDALGGSTAPVAPRRGAKPPRAGLIERFTDVALPFVLPRTAADMPLWVDADEHARR
ncbi:MAG: hypothetical protein R3F34_20980, partial [Planctomycetota bacterium]